METILVGMHAIKSAAPIENRSLGMGAVPIATVYQKTLYSMKQPDLHYFEAIKMTSQAYRWAVQKDQALYFLVRTE